MTSRTHSQTNKFQLITVIIISIISGIFCLLSFVHHNTIFLLGSLSFMLGLLVFIFIVFERQASLKIHLETQTEKLKLQLRETHMIFDTIEPALKLLCLEDTAIKKACNDPRTPIEYNFTGKTSFERIGEFSKTFKAPYAEDIEFVLPNTAFSDNPEKIQEIELRIPYILEIFKRVIIHTESAATTLIDRFSTISEQTEKADNEAKAAIETLGSGKDGGEGLESLIRLSHESVVGRTTVISEFLKINHENADRVRKMSVLVTKSEELISGIEEIAEKSKLIAFNMAVESAKIGDRGLGFKVIVHELQRLNDQTTKFARDILEIVKSFRIYNQQLLDQWLVKSEQLTEKVKADTDQASLAVTALAKSYAVAGNLFRSLSENAIGVNKAMGDILESLQFQDITRQQIEGAASFIEEIEKQTKFLHENHEKMGLKFMDDKKIQKKIKETHESKMKVSKDHDIFNVIERRGK